MNKSDEEVAKKMLEMARKLEDEYPVVSERWYMLKEQLQEQLPTPEQTVKRMLAQIGNAADRRDWEAADGVEHDLFRYVLKAVAEDVPYGEVNALAKLALKSLEFTERSR